MSWHRASFSHFFPPRRPPALPIAQFLPWNCRVTVTEPRNASPVSPAEKGAVGWDARLDPRRPLSRISLKCRG